MWVYNAYCTPLGFKIALEILCHLMFVILWLRETPDVLTVPMCHPFPGRETQQNGEIVLLLLPLMPPPTLSRLIKHIPADYTHIEIHTIEWHTVKHRQKKLQTSDVWRGCPMRGSCSRLELDNELSVCGNNISQSAWTQNRTTGIVTSWMWHMYM